jgi:hypothetical protein
MCQWQTALDRHRFQRIPISRPTGTTHAVGLTLQSENAAEAVMATEQEIKDRHESRHNPSFSAELKFILAGHLPIRTFR